MLTHKLNKVIDCHNCSAQTCKLCKAAWDEEHFGRNCKEVETQDETTLRRRIEEDMTSTVVRNCPGCKAALVKSTGCNKITCRCGTMSCYICRKVSEWKYSYTLLYRDRWSGSPIGGRGRLKSEIQFFPCFCCLSFLKTCQLTHK